MMIDKSLYGMFLGVVAMLFVSVGNVEAQQRKAPGGGGNHDATIMIDGKEYFCLSFNGWTIGYSDNTGSDKDLFEYNCVAVKDAPRLFCFMTVTNPKTGLDVTLK